jgi:hypothetical protein
MMPIYCVLEAPLLIIVFHLQYYTTVACSILCFSLAFDPISSYFPIE